MEMGGRKMDNWLVTEASHRVELCLGSGESWLGGCAVA